MEKTYYTPRIEEFCVGFEYEWLFKVHQDGNNFEEWQKCIFAIENLNNHWVTSDNIKNGLCRVPYLTKEQIVVEGWDHLGSGWYSLEDVPGSIGYWNYIRLRIFGDSSFIKAYRSDPIDYPDCEQEYLFQGKIKNKSELKKLLTLLNIIK